ncbi:MAG: phosphoribosylformylglycinamidine synthase, purS protein [Candidatus Methanoliparum thermophilum]|uniref:Phosphoribosylformylglycinamidine synthase subunit PurS n=1 Tax=Methanoliparum thermophilum TaxID=2491083 RepID=A0A520KQZ1_METT2|nr:phosphoribosylformylglycinamidine synthase subunit PurS [Candidatus Methanoliparum sp. LAM-1]RZN64045.1 MAG: phosphoribosylformylglycinamidine synthase, purS protein [Candidatus Methanoliparum thermophilum]BDC35700.1 phosphoribosylformylglycinamidine synthase [Candidatus Methanoliparum sp. LAM-1]
MQAEIKIRLKNGISDPEGDNIKKALLLLGFDNVIRVKTLKSYIIEIDCEKKDDAIEEIKDICDKLLANPVIHDYYIEIIE